MALAGLENVEGVLIGIEHEALHALTHAHAVRPAIVAGIQPPEGVTDTTQPSASAVWMAACIDAKRSKASRSVSATCHGGMMPASGSGVLVQFSSQSVYGFVPP